MSKCKNPNCTCENCQCGDDCRCGEECRCGKDCSCGDNCQCTPENKCGDDCACGSKYTLPERCRNVFFRSGCTFWIKAVILAGSVNL